RAPDPPSWHWLNQYDAGRGHVTATGHAGAGGGVGGTNPRSAVCRASAVPHSTCPIDEMWSAARPSTIAPTTICVSPGASVSAPDDTSMRLSLALGSSQPVPTKGFPVTMNRVAVPVTGFTIAEPSVLRPRIEL